MKYVMKILQFSGRKAIYISSVIYKQIRKTLTYSTKPEKSIWYGKK